MRAKKMTLPSKTYDVDGFAAAQEFYPNGLTEGLPVVPSTEAAVEACLNWALMPPDQRIGIEPVRAQPTEMSRRPSASSSSAVNSGAFANSASKIPATCSIGERSAA